MQWLNVLIELFFQANVTARKALARMSLSGKNCLST